MDYDKALSGLEAFFKANAESFRPIQRERMNLAIDYLRQAKESVTKEKSREKINLIEAKSLTDQLIDQFQGSGISVRILVEVSGDIDKRLKEIDPPRLDHWQPGLKW